jgi:tRNA A37 threonylcarbamoyladenosine biosynthesis protein TsaE
VVEWSEKAQAFLPDNTVRVRFTIEGDGRRTLRIAGLEA